MMKLLAVLLTFVFIPGALAAEESTVRITKSDCVYLAEHQTSADVAYQPGVDVRGREVAPADVGTAPALKNLVPEVLEFPIALNPLKGGAARFGETSLTVGTVSFDMKTKRASFNGKPLTRGETRRLAKKCKEILRTTR